MSSKIKKILILFFVILVVFLRFYNLEETTRFTRDESQNLVDMHRIWVDKELTLVGPIDVTKTIIYPSLTFYMLLPFAILGGFEPFSPALGTAFYGAITVFLLIYLAKQVNKKFYLWIAALSLVWFPLLETARWAWNPHLVPFMSAIALILFLQKGKWWKLLSGIFFGLTFHLHYLFFVGFAAFAGLWGIYSFYKKKFKPPLFLGAGFGLTILPFIYFDIKNPPGLFFGRFMESNLLRSGIERETASFWTTFAGNIPKVLDFLAQSRVLGVVLGLIMLMLLVRDIKKRRKSLFYFAAVVAQTAVISFLPTFQTRYFLLSIVFFVVWLIYKRGGREGLLAKIAILIMFIGSVFQIRPVLTETIRPPDTKTIRIATDYIKETIEEKDLKNVNLAVLASPDEDPLGVVYRHTLLVKEVRLMEAEEYGITDNLFVISTSEVEEVRDDPAHMMNGFRQGKLVETYKLNEGEWRVYLLERG